MSWVTPKLVVMTFGTDMRMAYNNLKSYECTQFRSYLMSFTENKTPKTIIDTCKIIKTGKGIRI